MYNEMIAAAEKIYNARKLTPAEKKQKLIELTEDFVYGGNVTLKDFETFLAYGTKMNAEIF